MIKRASVVIIGGGIIGCSIAYNLAKMGCKNIILLEKNTLASVVLPEGAEQESDSNSVPR